MIFFKIEKLGRARISRHQTPTDTFLEFQFAFRQDTLEICPPMKGRLAAPPGKEQSSDVLAVDRAITPGWRCRIVFEDAPSNIAGYHFGGILESRRRRGSNVCVAIVSPVRRSSRSTVTLVQGLAFFLPWGSIQT